MNIYELMAALDEIIKKDIPGAGTAHVEILRHASDGGGHLLEGVRFNPETKCVELIAEYNRRIRSR